MVTVGDPHDQVLASRNDHAVDVGKLHSLNGRRVEVHQLYLLICLDVPAHDLLFGRLGPRDQVLAVWGESCFKDGSGAEFIEGGLKLVFELALERVD